MYFLENSNLRVTVSNFLKNHSMYHALSYSFSVVFLVLLDYNFQCGGLKWNRTIDLTLIRHAL